MKQRLDQHKKLHQTNKPKNAKQKLNKLFQQSYLVKENNSENELKQLVTKKLVATSLKLSKFSKEILEQHKPIISHEFLEKKRKEQQMKECLQKIKVIKNPKTQLVHFFKNNQQIIKNY